MKIKNILSVGAACSALFTGAQAQEESPFSFSASLDQNSHFMSYGANVWGDKTENIGDGGTFNPSVGLNYALSDSSGIYAGAWFDINSYDTGDISGLDLGSKVQEMDLWLGYYFSVDKFTFDFTYQAWLYAGENEGIFDLAISYDTTFAPYVKFHNRIEVVGAAYDEKGEPGQQKGTMIEVGGTLYEGEYEGIGYGVSAGVGFSLDDYHKAGEEGYAYSFIGASASKVIYSSDSVEVDLHGGLTYYDVSNTTTKNTESGYLTSNIGVGFSF